MKKSAAARLQTRNRGTSILLRANTSTKTTVPLPSSASRKTTHTPHRRVHQSNRSSHGINGAVRQIRSGQVRSLHTRSGHAMAEQRKCCISLKSLKRYIKLETNSTIVNVIELRTLNASLFEMIKMTNKSAIHCHLFQATAVGNGNGAIHFAGGAGPSWNFRATFQFPSRHCLIYSKYR